MKKSLLVIGFAAVVGILPGCATIMGSDTHTMPISSNPSDAVVQVTDEKGTQVFKGNTPTTVTLAKSDGSYFGKKAYTVSISKPGFESQSIPVTGTVNGWYIGNIVFGGLIGWLIIDPLNGKMYNLSPENISPTLNAAAKTTHNNSATEGGISIVLLENVPADLRGKMQLIN